MVPSGLRTKSPQQFRDTTSEWDRMTDADQPDIYADSINVTAGRYGFTLTLIVGDPHPNEAQPRQRVVGRVRISPDLAGALARTLIQAHSVQKQEQSKLEKEDGNR